MRSLLIEFFRFGAVDTGLLRPGDRYIVAAASHPVREVEMPLDHETFLELMQALRYKAGPVARENALNQIRTVVTQLLRADKLSDLEEGDFPLQLDLVVNAAELASLPFEGCLDRHGEPILLRKEKPIVLTRRVRVDFPQSRTGWPAIPRMLFAWAFPSGSGVRVPYQEHEDMLRKALTPWIPPRGPAGDRHDTSGVLQIIEKASLDSIARACQAAVENGKPFTHVHLLAHGYPTGKQFGLALHASGPDSDDLEAVTPEALAGALAPLSGHTIILSLAACDAGSEANPTIPRRSIAHQLHVAGFPVVVTSQLPLTVAGSTIFVESFYRDLLAGMDVRDALHQARRALYENSKTTGHDWASLVGYACLPERYVDYLQIVRLQSVMMSLRALQSWSDELLLGETIDPVEFDRLVHLLRERAQELESFLQSSDKGPKGVAEENLGLLGSTHKRLAELYFEYGKRNPTAAWRDVMHDALTRAQSWYKRAFERNLSHHWSGVQFLCLSIVLDGKIADPGLWYVAVWAAKSAANDSGTTEKIWANGSLLELYLIASAAGQGDQTDKAADAATTMIGLLAGNPDQFPRESTRRQLQRYVNWWTEANGLYTGKGDLQKRARELIFLLDQA